MSEAATESRERPDPPSASCAVTLTGITKQFDDVIAVDSVSLEVGDGEFFSLLGPSGCGKTTTLRMIAGLEVPTQGSLQIYGEEMGVRPPNKRPVNTVFQSYALFPHMDVATNVAFGLAMQRVRKPERAERVATAIGLVQLGGMEDRKPSQLSGGQQQRVALARALVNQPKVLLLDEPLGALDLKLRQAMQLELKELQVRVGITFVYVTHDQEEAMTMSDRIAVMDEGRLLQVGEPETIYEQPASRFVADFIGETNFLPGTVEGPGLVCLRNGDRLEIATDLEVGRDVAIAVRPERITLTSGTDVPDDDPHCLAGKVSRVTFMGNALVYDVVFDWLTISVRHENTQGVKRFAAGDAVVASWDETAAAVVPD